MRHKLALLGTATSLALLGGVAIAGPGVVLQGRP